MTGLVSVWLTAMAAPPMLHAPIACRLGADCWITSRPDTDPSGGFRDHAGGSHTYDGHKGTDWAVAGVDEARSTDVLAPVAGTVRRLRDGVPDGELIAGKTIDTNEACGNGVVVGLDEGWEIQLCHLLQGSVRVKPGERVEVGTPVGKVGWSGKADHPHVHVTVRHSGRVVDPFTGLAIDDGARLAPASMWFVQPVAPVLQDALAWAGFRSGPRDVGPEWPVETGADVVGATAKTVVLEVFLWRPMEGDVVRTEVRRPDGTVARATVVQPRDRPRQVWRIEKDLTEEPRPTGRWTATVTWEREGRTRTVTTSTLVQ